MFDLNLKKIKEVLPNNTGLKTFRNNIGIMNIHITFEKELEENNSILLKKFLNEILDTQIILFNTDEKLFWKIELKRNIYRIIE